MHLDKIHKLKKWKDAQQWTSSMVDHLGKPLDPGILEVVSVFRYLDIHTVMSCEGHVEGGFAGPWVDVLEPKGSAILEDIYEFLRRHPSKEVPKKLRAARLAARKRNFNYTKPLAAALEKFYKTHNTTPWDRRIVMTWTMDGEVRLLCQGTWLNEVASRRVKFKKIQEYRREMNNFCSYLLKTF